MKIHPWLCGAVLSMLNGAVSFPALAAGAASSPVGDKVAGATVAPKPAVRAKASGEEEGRFAPKGKTGRLRQEEVLANAEGRGEGGEQASYVGMSEPEGTGRLGLDMVWGFGKLGQASAALSPELRSYDKISVATFVAYGEYAIARDVRLSLQVPFATGTVTPPEVVNQQSYNASALGNLTLEAVYDAQLGDRSRLPIGIALSAPTASGDSFASSSDQNDPSVRQSIIGAAAQAARGYERDELFASHRLGITPSATFEYRYGFGRFAAFTRVPLLVRAGGEDSPAQGTTADGRTANSLAVEWVVGVRAHYGLVPRLLDVGVRAWLTYFAVNAIDVPVTDGATGPSNSQFVLSPEVVGHFGPLRVIASLLFPIDGRIGGDYVVDGLRVGAAYGF